MPCDAFPTGSFTLTQQPFDGRRYAAPNRYTHRRMSLASGSLLGPYVIVEPLGSGGMGVVYRAHDSRLQRDVALKAMHAEGPVDESARRRFEREARAIAALSHPNICAVYDVGFDRGTDYLVMELLDGEGLADRLVRGPLPVPEALRVGRQIAEALSAAHSAGIVHRDLKPGNVMLTKAGAKLLDFGLATRLAPPVAVDNLTTTAAALTRPGVVMGTWPYMAPEQFLGQAVDARTDVFAFGVVLYEMLAGQRPFRGESAAAVMAGVLEREPLDLTSAAPSVPRPLARLVEKCLAKSADARWQSMRDLGDALRWVEEDLVRTEARSSDAVLPQRRWWLLLVPLAIGLAIAVGWVARAPSPLPDTAVMRLTIPTGDLDTGQVDSPEISPDGRLVVFGARPRAGGPVGLYVYDFASATTRRIEGTESAQYPFWSADSRSVGFFADGGVSRVDVAGGAPQVIVERGNDWGGREPGSSELRGARTTSSWRRSDMGSTSSRHAEDSHSR